MKNFIAYSRYFFYLAFNWNLRLALFIMRHEIRGEKKYGVYTTGIDDLKNSVAEAELEHASIYQPVNFYTAEKLMDTLNYEDKIGGFLDVGCGKGRVLGIAAAYGFTDITGIDFSAALCHAAIEQAEIIEARNPKAQIIIDCMDAREFEIEPNVTVIFLFNPFDDLVMADFILQVQESLRLFPRKLKLLYANPVCKKQWLAAGFHETYHFKKLSWLEGSVLEWTGKA